LTRAGRVALVAWLVIAACAPGVAPAAVSGSPSDRTPAETPSTAAPPSTASTESPLPTEVASPSPLPARCAAPASVDVVAYCPQGARVDIDAAVGERDAAAVLAQVGDDLAAVQREFEWTLKGTPRIDVYASRERYIAGLSSVFGYPRPTAEYLADNSVAFFEPSLARIAVSWDAVRDRRPIAAIRHELTHVVTLEACAPRCDLVPAWLNEGQARLAEALIPGADWRLLRVRYEAASMVATATLLPLTVLWTQSQWNSLGDWEGYYKYQEAARVTELLRADIGERAIAKLYARIRSGQDVQHAYAALTGRSFGDFASSLDSRIVAGAPAGPAIALASPGAGGGATSYLLYAFPGSSTPTLRIRARHVDELREIAVSPQGAYFASLDDAYPPGVYIVSATLGGTTVTVTTTKRGGRTPQVRFD
jgi:hypothetical protein